MLRDTRRPNPEANGATSPPRNPRPSIQLRKRHRSDYFTPTTCTMRRFETTCPSRTVSAPFPFYSKSAQSCFPRVEAQKDHQASTRRRRRFPSNPRSTTQPKKKENPKIKAKQTEFNAPLIARFLPLWPRTESTEAKRLREKNFCYPLDTTTLFLFLPWSTFLFFFFSLLYLPEPKTGSPPPLPPPVFLCVLSGVFRCPGEHRGRITGGNVEGGEGRQWFSSVHKPPLFSFEVALLLESCVTFRTFFSSPFSFFFFGSPSHSVRFASFSLRGVSFLSVDGALA